MDNNECFWLLAIDLLLGVVLMVAVTMRETTVSKWQSECVRRGVAEYDQTTGKWRWKAEFDLKEKSDAK